MLKQILIIGMMFCVILFFDCSQNGTSPGPDISEKMIDELQISKNFNYRTSNQVLLNIKDSDGVVYAVYAYNENIQQEILDITLNDGTTRTDTLPVYDDGNRMLSSGRIVDGVFSTLVQLPDYIEDLYLIRNNRGHFTSVILPIVGDEVHYCYSLLAKANADITGKLIVVNEFMEFFTISTNENYALELLAPLPVDDVSTVAYDPINQLVYFCEQSSKKSLYSYSPQSETFEKISDIKTYADRMAYNPNDGLLYLGTQTKIYTMDPTNGNVLSSFKVSGINGSTSSGDLAFDSDGHLYQLSREGLYLLTPGETEFIAEWIGSAGQTTTEFIGGLAIDIDGTFWASTYQGNNTTGYLMRFNPVTHVFEKVKEYNDYVMYDFAIAPAGASYYGDDVDEDGVEDELDAYPTDPQLAFNNYSPGQSQVGSYAFEDLWPTVGDYDFNDLVIDYSINRITNAQNIIKKMRIHFLVSNIGGSFINGFGIRLDTIQSDEVESVIGTRLTEGFIETAANGLEAGESVATIIVFDNATLQEGIPIELEIQFEKGVTWDHMQDVINPFIFINKNRARELHLPEMQSTQKANPNEQFQYVVLNNDTDANFKNNNNLPWAIHIPFKFEYTLPGTAVNEAYIYFNEWAETSGASYKDWYKDLPGYRRVNKLAEN